jgi:hypothetical protein
LKEIQFGAPSRVIATPRANAAFAAWLAIDDRIRRPLCLCFNQNFSFV